jgi:hypothetical protein
MVNDRLMGVRKWLAWALPVVLLCFGATALRAIEAGLPQAAGAAPQAGAKAGAATDTKKAAAPKPKAAAVPMKPKAATSAATHKAAATKPSGKKVSAKKAASKKPAGESARTAKGPEMAGRRDPFKLPGPPVPGGAGGEQILGPLPPGARWLLIGQLKVEGIVRLDTTSTMIAVVDNSSNRAYFLRENDAVYNGVVSKITPDSVVFRENALDASGKMVVRDVVKRLGQGPGA